MMVEEDKKPEDKEEVLKPKEKDEEKDKPLSLYDKTEAIVTRQEEANKKTEELLARQEKLYANERLAGTAGGHVEAPKPTRLTDIEYAEALERGEVNPLKEDGFLK